MKKARLAIDGGRPVRSSPLAFHQADIGEKELSAIRAVFESGWLTRGKLTQKFEKAFAKLKGADYALAVSSCTSALELALRVAGVGAEDEVILSPLAFPSPANAVVRLGGKPIFVDAREDTFCLDEKKVESAITTKTKAVICVHYGGSPCEMRLLLGICRERKIFLIEDCAHAVHASYLGKPLGTWGDFGCFSFYPTKELTTIEGGMLLCKRKAHREVAYRWHLHGFIEDGAEDWRGGIPPVKDAIKIRTPKVRDSTLPGHKFNLTDVESAVGLVQLKKVKRAWRRRRQIARTYDDAFSRLSGIRLQKHLPGASPSYHLYPIVLWEKSLRRHREKIMEALLAEGISTSTHFYPVHLMSFYRKAFGTRMGLFPVAERIGLGVITLPIYHLMTDKDVDDVISALFRVLAHFSAP